MNMRTWTREQQAENRKKAAMNAMHIACGRIWMEVERAKQAGEFMIPLSVLLDVPTQDQILNDSWRTLRWMPDPGRPVMPAEIANPSPIAARAYSDGSFHVLYGEDMIADGSTAPQGTVGVAKSRVALALYGNDGFYGNWR